MQHSAWGLTMKSAWPCRSGNAANRRGKSSGARIPRRSARHEVESGKKKAHKHKLFGPVALGTTPRCPLSGPVLRDTARLSQRYPPIARYGVLVSQHGHLGAIPPSPSLSVSPLESMRSGGAIPSLKRGISAILA